MGLLVLELAAAYLPVPVWAQMLPATLMIIYIGAKSSAIKGEHAPVRHTPRRRSCCASCDMVWQVSEKMSTSDAYKFPFIGSAVLFSLYAVFKFLPKEYINLVVKAYAPAAVLPRPSPSALSLTVVLRCDASTRYFFLFGVLVLAAQLTRAVTLALPPALAKSSAVPVLAIPIPSMCRSKPAEAPKNDNEKATAATDDNKDAAPKVAEPAVAAPAAAAVAPASDAKDGVAAPRDDAIELSKLDILMHIVAMALGAWYLATNHWSAR